MTLWIIETLLFAGMVSLIWAVLDILGGDHCADAERHESARPKPRKGSPRMLKVVV
jgi:hypothetical protein